MQVFGTGEGGHGGAGIVTGSKDSQVDLSVGADGEGGMLGVPVGPFGEMQHHSVVMAEVVSMSSHLT
ncbi:hypothetical protein [Streptomyces sp. NRRL F-2664]|uniref:hypothetical protein n=1 Tax=Streptomyces sp. NRRL F-2664 TaxID=1463842 RepID=UPI00068A34F0|nr:hypothetical protein [Streptomyces sp. NRRL F-2664]